MRLNIILLPPEDVRRSVAAFSGEIAKKFALNWRVDNTKLIPHISLYHLEIKDNDLDKLYATLEKVLVKQQPVAVRPGEILAANITFGLTAEGGNQLYNLHKKIVLGMRRTRKGVIEPPPGFGAEEAFLINNYGAADVLKNFWPHITLGMPQNKADMDALLKYSKGRKVIDGFSGDTIAIGEIDKYWQVTKIIKSFKLE